MYYILVGKPYHDLSPIAKVDEYLDAPDVDWYRGLRFNEKITEPIRCVLDPEVEGPVPLFLEGTIPIFEESLLQAMLDAGVDNIDTYDTVIVDEETGEEFHEYKAVNIVGLVSAADLTKSRFTSYQPTPLIAVDFDSLVIDESRTNGLLLFRLAESVSTIVVHEKVAKVITERDLYVGLIDPKDHIS